MRAHNAKVYEIENETYTIKKVKALLSCSESTAKRRLLNSTTTDELLRPLEKLVCKEFIIEGQVITSAMVVDRVGCTPKTAILRLNSCTTLEDVYRAMGVHVNFKCNSYNKKLLNPEDLIFKLTYEKW